MTNWIYSDDIAFEFGIDHREVYSDISDAISVVSRASESFDNRLYKYEIVDYDLDTVGYRINFFLFILLVSKNKAYKDFDVVYKFVTRL